MYSDTSNVLDGIFGQRMTVACLVPDGGIIAGFTNPEGHLIGLVQGPAGM